METLMTNIMTLILKLLSYHKTYIAGDSCLRPLIIHIVLLGFLYIETPTHLSENHSYFIALFNCYDTFFLVSNQGAARMNRSMLGWSK